MFTDRVSEQELVSRLMAPHDETVTPQRHDFLTVFYGVGGVGKTSLCRKVSTSSLELYPSVAVVILNLDHDRWTPTSGFFHFLVELVNELTKQGISTPLTQALLLMYSHADAAARLPSKSSDLWPGAVAVLDQATQAVGIPGIGLLIQGTQWLKDRKHQADVRQRLQKLELWPEEAQGGRINLLDLEEKLTQALFEDLRQWAVPGRNLRILLDGFERIQSRDHRRDCQMLLQQWAGYVAAAEEPTLVGRVRLLVFGRDRLKWDELYNDPDWRDCWTQHLLEGLGETDALDFLGKFSAWLIAHGEPEAAASIVKRSAAILDAADENVSGNRRIYPYYLDLAVKMVRDGARSGSIRQLGTSPSELQTRFFRYLKPEELHLLKILALAETFDAELFDALIRDHRVSGFAVGTFPSAVVEGRSYVAESGTKAFRFHRLMENALQDLWLKSDAEREQGRETCRWLLDRLEQYLASNLRKDWGEVEIETWRRGMEIIVSQGFERDLLPLDECQERCVRDIWSTDFPVPFDMAVGFLYRIRQSLESRLGTQNPRSLVANSNLAGSYSNAGLIEEALDLRVNVLSLIEKQFKKEHPVTLKAMNNLADSYSDVGRLDEALVLRERVLRLRREKLGAEHPITLKSMNNLAVSFSDVGRLEEALDLRAEVLQLMQKEHGLEHPDTLSAMSNLANSYSNAGRLEDAYNLRKKVLRLRCAKLGAEHPDTISAINNLANSYSETGRLKEAIDLYNKVLRLRHEKLGAEHPDTISAMNNLAVSYSEADLPEEALDLSEQVLRLRRDKLGLEHLDTLSAMNNLAVSYSDAGRLEESLDLITEVLRLRLKKLGAAHPQTLNAMRSLAIIYNRTGRRKEALILLRNYAAATDNTGGFFAYDIACYECLEGNEHEAKRLISEHLEKNPKAREQALADPDFATIRDWITELHLPSAEADAVPNNENEQLTEPE